MKIYLSSYWGSLFVVSWEIDGEKYTQREDFFFPYLFREPGGANACTPLQAHQRRLWSASSPTLDSDSQNSKSDCMVITWSHSGYTPVGPDCHDALSSSCLLITTWQPVKAHGVTRNEPKIHVICYITVVIQSRVKLKDISRNEDIK